MGWKPPRTNRKRHTEIGLRHVAANLPPLSFPDPEADPVPLDEMINRGEELKNEPDEDTTIHPDPSDSESGA